MSSAVQTATEQIAPEEQTQLPEEKGHVVVALIATLREKLTFNGAELREQFNDWLHRAGVWYLGSAVAHMLVLVVVGLVLGSMHMVTRPVNQEAPSFDTTLDTAVLSDMSLPLELGEMTGQQAPSASEIETASTSPAGDADAGGSVSGISSPTLGRGLTGTGSGSAGSGGPGGGGSGAGGSGTHVRMGDIERVGGRGTRLNMEVPVGTKGEPSAVVDNYQQAMDRITQEILLRLSKDKVLVVWCLDQSESMKDDIKEIRQRIDRVYIELGIVKASQGDALLTSVVSYGQSMRVHTRYPTADLDKIRAAMDEVPVDSSGMEMQCQTVGYAIANHRSYVTSGRRQMMLILVTDESGNPGENYQYLENTIAEAKAARCPIYVIGREAVFGYPYAHMWTTVTGPAVGGGIASRNYLVAIDRGPETPFVEQLQTDGFHERHDAHPSGFGPYEQVRMVRETGGVFFILPSPEINLFQRDNRKYELEYMRPYLPDLSSREDYANERDKHPSRATIWQVINDLNPYKPERGQYINMRMDFSPEPAAFVNQVRTEQAKAKQYVLYLNAAEKALEGMRKEREREASPRWQANYDLIFAQLLAYKVRIYEYGAYLDAFIKNPKQADIPKPDRQLHYWRIATRQKTITGDLVSSEIERSRLAFEAVKRDHAGTPYAARADVELKRGFGVELNAVYYNPTYHPPVPVTPFVAPKL
jgi:hypothetical protein